jgi:hypothetical protein
MMIKRRISRINEIIPARLHDWTYEKIKEMIDKNQNESIWHDYKENIPDTKGLTKDCCAALIINFIVHCTIDLK